MAGDWRPFTFVFQVETAPEWGKPSGLRGDFGLTSAYNDTALCRKKTSGS
jgi:hypothetical protein